MKRRSCRCAAANWRIVRMVVAQAHLLVHHSQNSQNMNQRGLTSETSETCMRSHLNLRILANGDQLLHHSHNSPIRSRKYIVLA